MIPRNNRLSSEILGIYIQHLPTIINSRLHGRGLPALGAISAPLLLASLYINSKYWQLYVYLGQGLQSCMGARTAPKD